MKVYTDDNGFGKSPESSVISRVWIDCVKEHMREFNYMAECAKLGSSISSGPDNIAFSYAGFNDKMPEFIT